jgi:hypothetical protein
MLDLFSLPLEPFHCVAVPLERGGLVIYHPVFAAG